MRNFLKSFFHRDAGTSAIEFAFIAPVLIVIAVSVSDVSDIVRGGAQMQTALRAGVQYGMNGGTDDAKAKSQVVEAWDDKPADATVTSSTACKCGAAAAACGGPPCPNGKAPSLFLTVSASAPLGGDVVKINKSMTRTVQVK